MGPVAIAIVAAVLGAEPSASAASAQLRVSAVVVRTAIVAVAPAAARGVAGASREPGDGMHGAGGAATVTVRSRSPVIFTDGAPPSFTLRARAVRVAAPAATMAGSR